MLNCTGTGPYPCPESIYVAMDVVADDDELTDTLDEAGWKVALMQFDDADVVCPICQTCALMAAIQGDLATSGVTA